MIKPRISIIMPVYNGAQFILESLGSLLNQITDALEVIVVDDGSKDDTVVLISQHFQHFIKRQQLIVYSETNQGVSAARNVGIDHAQGDYIGFMDADDIVLPHYIETILSVLDHNNDIVEFGFKRFVDSAAETTTAEAEYCNNQFGPHTISSVIDGAYSTARWYPCTRIFKNNLFDGVRFPLGVSFCEDLMTIPKLYENAETILIMKDALYGYRINPNSATYKVGQDNVESLVEYYGTIPTSDLIRHQYLRLSVAFAILSCQTKATGDWDLPQHIQSDLSKLRRCWPIYCNIELRRVAALLYPATYKCFVKIFRVLNKQKFR